MRDIAFKRVFINQGGTAGICAMLGPSFFEGRFFIYDFINLRRIENENHTKRRQQLRGRAGHLRA